MNKNKRIIKYFLIVAALLISIAPFSGSKVIAQEEKDKPIQVISDFEDLFIFAQASKNYDYAGVEVVLDADIKIDKIEQSMLEHYGISHLTVGSKDMPFRGTFNGQNHKIIGLKYDANIIKDANSGLFSFIDGATIENLIVEDATLDCAFQGGMIVGKAYNSILRNITVLNSKLKITPANNVVSLVTNGGFSGGGIAGIIEDTLMYNCEVSGTEVVNNSTSGVTGVGGEGLYMGALVGWANNSTIEYCRARANYAGESEKELRNTTVRNDYDIAVGALGGKSVYAGGIVGGVNGHTEIIDCFSTADVSFDVRNYVAVGSGIAGYAGGITGALRGNSKIERCHYAGDIKSYQYNAVLVIPIIQHNVNINGITRIYEDSSTVVNSYFKPSAIKSGVTIAAVRDENTESYCPKDDDTYVNIDFWESKDYDFIGNQVRTSRLYQKEHTNRWTMDEDLGIPVHGTSVMATFDFPGAAEISIKESALVHKEATTDNPLNFAIQGIHPREKKETTITLKLNNVDENNPDYRLRSWHKVMDVNTHVIDSVTKIHDKLNDQNIIANTNNSLAITVEIDNPITEPVDYPDLFVADVEASVVFHDVDGNPLEGHTYWHRYETALEDVKLNSSDNGAIFFGWTTMGKLNDQQIMTGYSAITSTELNDIIQRDELYNVGDLVEKPMKLYPIFINSSANVITEFEGHENDNIDDKTIRENVGKTEVLINDQNEVVIKALAEDGSTTFPDGYVFKGWYQRFEDGSEYCVSNDLEYVVPDISKPVTYIAEFKYRVDYMVRAFKGDSGGTFEIPELYATKYYDYKKPFENIKGPEFILESVINWGKESIKHYNREECNDYFNGNIIKPEVVYSHNIVTKTVDGDSYAVRMRSDFPNSGSFTSEKLPGGKVEYTFTPINDRYHLQFWTLEEINSKKGWSFKNNPMDTGTMLTINQFDGYAIVSTDVNFHKSEDDVKTVQRRYDSPIFRDSDYKHQYKYPLSKNDVSIDTYDGGKIDGYLIEEASYSNADMQKDGYQFLGWVSKNELSESEWKYIFDTNEWGVTSDVYKVRPYLLNSEWIDSNNLTERYQVKETMDLYPVYAKYDIKTTTNLEDATNLPSGVNRPNKPSYEITASDKYGVANIKVTAESNKTEVMNGSKKYYQLTSLLCEVDGKTQKLTATLDNQGNYVYQSEIVASKGYKFIAIYSPAFVTYHLNDSDNTEIVIKDIGSTLGNTLLVDFNNISDISTAYFAGWTTQKPDNGVVWKFDNKQSYDEKALVLESSNTIIKTSIDLYPVFIKANINVISNIDNVITDENNNPLEYRFINRKDDGSLEINIKPYPGYSFNAWYEGDVEVTKDRNKLLSMDELFSGKTYTAVFNEAHQVTYFDDDGNEIYKVNVIDGSRSFVEEKTIDVDGKPTKQEVMIDTEAFIKLSEKLQSNEIFYEWEWVDNGNKIAWLDFKNKNITQDMNLYPKIAIVNTFDSDKNDITNKLDYHLSSKDNKVELVSILKEEYLKPNLTISLEAKTYDPLINQMNQHPIKKLDTRVYIDKQMDSEGQGTGFKEASKGPIYTNDNGEALHEFYGRIIIQKEYDDKTINRNIFINITNMNNGECLSVPLEVINGKGVQSIILPIGEYQVKEEMRWTWRDEASANIKNPIVLKIGDEVVIKINNREVNGKWFSDETHIKNVFN